MGHYWSSLVRAHLRWVAELNTTQIVGTRGATWNPVTGRIEAYTLGRDHCYAETFAERRRAVPGHPATSARLRPPSFALSYSHQPICSGSTRSDLRETRW